MSLQSIIRNSIIKQTPNFLESIMRKNDQKVLTMRPLGGSFGPLGAFLHLRNSIQYQASGIQYPDALASRR